MYQDISLKHKYFTLKLILYAIYESYGIYHDILFYIFLRNIIRFLLKKKKITNDKVKNIKNSIIFLFFKIIIFKFYHIFNYSILKLK